MVATDILRNFVAVYDLKQMLQATKQVIPSELAQHAAAKNKVRLLLSDPLLGLELLSLCPPFFFFSALHYALF